jgi:hypothetical protein
MNKSKRLRLERQAYLSKRRECELLIARERQKLIETFISLGIEVDKELLQEACGINTTK